MRSSFLFGKSVSESSEALQVVKILREYNQPIPQDFLIKLVNWNKTEAKNQLESLEKAGLIKLKGNNVELVRK